MPIQVRVGLSAVQLKSLRQKQSDKSFQIISRWNTNLAEACNRLRLQEGLHSMGQAQSGLHGG